MSFCYASFIFLIASGEAWYDCSITSKVLSGVRLKLEVMSNIPSTGGSTRTMTHWLVDSGFLC